MRILRRRGAGDAAPGDGTAGTEGAGPGDAAPARPGDPANLDLFDVGAYGAPRPPVAAAAFEDAAGGDADPDLEGLAAALPDEGGFDPVVGTDAEEIPVPARRAREAERLAQRRQSLPLRIALGGAVVFVVGLLLTAGAKSYRDLETVRQREAELAVRIAASEERLEDLRHRIELLRDDPATLERLAREELGLVGKDDLVFVLPTAPPE